MLDAIGRIRGAIRREAAAIVEAKQQSKTPPQQTSPVEQPASTSTTRNPHEQPVTTPVRTAEDLASTSTSTPKPVGDVGTSVRPDVVTTDERVTTVVLPTGEKVKAEEMVMQYFDLNRQRSAR